MLQKVRTLLKQLQVKLNLFKKKWKLYSMEFRDQLDRAVNILNIPTRIVSLVPSQTELLVDLGLENRIVGVTKFCVHPNDIRKKATVVGGTKKVNYQKIIDLNPDFILCNKEENTLEMVEKLESIAPVWISDMYNIEDCKEMILMLGTIFQREEANRLVSEINLAQKDFLDFIESKQFQKVLYLIWKNPFMAAGQNTFINELLILNKFENALYDSESRYPEVFLEDFPEVDTILLSTEPYPFKLDDVDDLEKKLNKKVILVDGEYFSWYGSRLIKAFDYFKTLHK